MYFYKLYSFDFLLIFRLQDLYTRIPLYKNRFFSPNSILISRFYCNRSVMTEDSYRMNWNTRPGLIFRRVPILKYMHGAIFETGGLT
jgi:hypothetical protein